MLRFIILSWLIFCNNTSSSKAEECSSNNTYLVFESKNGNIISENQADEIRYPASLTKLMTLYLTFEAIKQGKISLGQILKASDRAEDISKINKINTLKLKESDKITVKDAIKGSIIKSFNETTLILAEAVSGNEWDFVKKMNQKAHQLGMVNSNFRNSYGLDDPGQYTTGRDLARLTLAMINNFPEFYHLFSLKEFQYHGQKYQTTNYFLNEYKGAEGIKTGFTKNAGFNLIATAKRKNYRLVSILLSCESYQKRDQLTKDLLDQGFDKIGNHPKSSSKINVKNSPGS